MGFRGAALRFLVSAVVVLFFANANAITIDASNPYRGIVDRNVFGLKDPPPPPPPNPDANKPPAPPITLTGISTVLGTKRAFMTLQLPAKPPEPAKTASLMLSEGQRDGEVEVLQIDEKEKVVKINSYGSITNLSFEKNGAKGSGGGSTPAVANSGIPAPANVFSPGSSGVPRTIPTRMVRLPGGANPAAMTPGGEGSGSPALFTPGSTQPSASVNGASVPLFSPGSQASAASQPQNAGQFTPAQQEVLIEAEHQLALSKGSPDAGIYPPTYANPNRNVVHEQQPGQNTPGSPQVPLPSPGKARPY